MEHVLAILGLAVACGVWVLLQRSSDAPCTGSCGACAGRGGAGEADAEAEPEALQPGQPAPRKACRRRPG